MSLKEEKDRLSSFELCNGGVLVENPSHIQETKLEGSFDLIHD